MDLLNIIKYIQYGGDEESEEDDGGECLIKCEEQEPTMNPFNKIYRFFSCWIPVSERTYKEILLPCSMQHVVNVTIKFFVGLFGIILLPLWPWILITYYTWHNFNKFILTVLLGPSGLKFNQLSKYIACVIIVIIAMLFILD